MPTLNWIGKEAVVEHHKEVPFHLLRCDPDLSVGEVESGNLLIQGDNLLALKALLPYYAGKVKLIYIDPPYNTGNEGWVYNDNVNSPEIKDWLGRVVGKEAEDLSRHDKWLCMMYPRLALAREFLSDDGIIFVSIDDNELQNLKAILDEFFNRKNLLANFIWQTEGNFDNQAKVKIAHEYILAYAKDYNRFPHPPIIDPNTPEDSKLFRSEIRNTIVKNGPKNPISGVVLPIGFPADFENGVIKKRTDSWPHYEEDVIVKDSKLVNEVIAKSGWSSKRIFQSFISNNFMPVLDTKGQETIFVITKTGAIEAIKIRPENQSHVISVLRNMGSTQQMSTELQEIGIQFEYPKPTKLIKYLISMIEEKDFIALDFFAGSGTTGQSIMEVNHEDNGNRHFILIELDKTIAVDVMQERLAKNNKRLNRKGFRFCTLDNPIFDASGQIRENVSFAELARHVFFTETGEPLPASNQTSEVLKTSEVSDASPLIGTSQGQAIYLLFNGILGDKSETGGNVLTRQILASLPAYAGPKVIYGEGCLLSPSTLQELGITFRQLPYEVKVN